MQVVIYLPTGRTTIVPGVTASDAGAARRCVICGVAIVGGGPRRYCVACKAQLARARSHAHRVQGVAQRVTPAAGQRAQSPPAADAAATRPCIACGAPVPAVAPQRYCVVCKRQQQATRTRELARARRERLRQVRALRELLPS